MRWPALARVMTDRYGVVDQSWIEDRQEMAWRVATTLSPESEGDEPLTVTLDRAERFWAGVLSSGESAWRRALDVEEDELATDGRPDWCVVWWMHEGCYT